MMLPHWAGSPLTYGEARRRFYANPPPPDAGPNWLDDRPDYWRHKGGRTAANKKRPACTVRGCYRVAKAPHPVVACYRCWDSRNVRD